RRQGDLPEAGGGRLGAGVLGGGGRQRGGGLEGGQRQQQDPDLACGGAAIQPGRPGGEQGSGHRQDHRQRHGRRGDRRGHGGAVDRRIVLVLVTSELDQVLVETAVQAQAGGVIEDLQCTRGHHGAGGDHGVLGEPGGAVGGQRGER